jgi:toxin HigB-1
MQVSFATTTVKDICESRKLATKKHGAPCATKLGRRLADLAAAPALEEFRSLPGRCHELTGDLEGKLALDLSGGKRLIIEPDHNPVPTHPDGGLSWKEVTAVQVVDIQDYH